MHIACLDLEGVLVPEIWIAVAARTGIAAFSRTVCDEPDCDRLTQQPGFIEWPYHRLETVGDASVPACKLRQPKPRLHAVNARKSPNFKVIAAGDSDDDTGMLGAANAGFFIHPPPGIVAQFPQFPQFARHDSHAGLQAPINPAAQRLQAA